MISLYNSMTKNVELLTPLDPSCVKLYVCGPTVYDEIHIGNMRAFAVFDLLYRVLQRKYDKVLYVRNITDVDDKIIDKAKSSGMSCSDVTSQNIESFRSLTAAFGFAKPDHEPCATDHIAQIQNMISKLIDMQYAYISHGNVFFAVESWDDYGKLSNRKLAEMYAGARVDVSREKRHPMDFALWKEAEDEDIGWSSPWGFGRPGWHIECSAMSREYLGAEFDIHGGGQDLLFPHHENERAQTCASEGTCDASARIWMHSGLILINGQKMSKSLGNVRRVSDLLDKHPVSVLRYSIFATHYRSMLDWSDERISSAASSIKKLQKSASPYLGHESQDIDEEFMRCLCDDLNTPAAIARMHQLALDDPRKLWHCMSFLGLVDEKKRDKSTLSEESIKTLVEERNEARRNRQYDRADEIRDMLFSEGVILEDGPEGTGWCFV